jgi:uncharacterized caspase-like protein
MSPRPFLLQLAGAALLTVAGLGLGFGMARWWGTEASPPHEPAPAKSRARLLRAPERRRAVAPETNPAEQGSAKRALLVGVTRYDHLPKAVHLSGPANDVQLMRKLLQECYRFPAAAIVTLTEDEGTPDRRPTRANIEREFRRLAEQSQQGDQVVILLAGHGARQPADADNREPDGIDEIFLPADVDKWRDFPEKVPNAIIDKEMGKWLQAITTKKAYVCIIFDCCHSGTMTRGTEVVRELPPGHLVPQTELDKARARAAQRGRTRGGPAEKPPAYVPREPSDYLVAIYACRETETTPESPQPLESPRAEYHGLLTYSLVDILTKSAASKAPLTYRELGQRLQVRYAARPQGSPTPLVEGKAQGLVVLGTEQPARPRLLLSRHQGTYKVNAGDLYGLTIGSVLAVYSPAGTDVEPKLLGHVRVGAIQAFEATVEPCAYEKSPVASDLPPLSTCQPVAIDYGLRRFKVALQVPPGQATARQQLMKALEPLGGTKDRLMEIVDDPRQAEWLICLDQGKVQLVEASDNRAPFVLPGPDSPGLNAALRRSLERIYRARNLIGLSSRFEDQRTRGTASVDVEVEVLRHKGEKAPGEVWPRPSGGWVFRPGDFISFRVTNKSESLSVDVTLLVVGSDFQIQPFYPREGEVAKSIKPGESIDTPPPPGQISNEPPFGPECLVVIAVPAKNPPADFSALAQEGLARARGVDGSNSLKSPLGQLLEAAMFRSGTRGPLTRKVAEQHGMRVLTWRTEPARASAP